MAILLLLFFLKTYVFIFLFSFCRVRPSKTPIYQGAESRKRARDDGEHTSLEVTPSFSPFFYLSSPFYSTLLFNPLPFYLFYYYYYYYFFFFFF